MNSLRIVEKSYPYEIDGVAQPPVRLSDFIVDEISLSEKFGLHALFGSTCFDELPEFHDKGVQELLGLTTPTNQFDSGRLVLYRCHCGCDYCGVISCSLKRHENSISWSDIRFEHDGGTENGEDYTGSIEFLEFALEEYRDTVNRYMGRSRT